MLRGRVRIVGILVIVAASCGGCGGFGGSVPVEGNVTLDGKPLKDATIMFAPTKANGPGPFVGTTDAQGQFNLAKPEDSRGGAAVGEYSVFIATVRSDPNAETSRAAKEIVPNEFRNGSKRYQVPPGGTKEANFDMKSR